MLLGVALEVAREEDHEFGPVFGVVEFSGPGFEVVFLFDKLLVALGSENLFIVVRRFAVVCHRGAEFGDAEVHFDDFFDIVLN